MLSCSAVGVKRRRLYSPLLCFSSCRIIFPVSTRGKGFTPYLVFSHCSNPNNEPARHSKRRGNSGSDLYKVAESISPVGYRPSDGGLQEKKKTKTHLATLSTGFYLNLKNGGVKINHQIYIFLINWIVFWILYICCSV